MSANRLEVWFLTGSQGLYGEDVLRQVADQSADVVRALTASDDLPLRLVQKPVLTSAESIRDTRVAATAS